MSPVVKISAVLIVFVFLTSDALAQKKTGKKPSRRTAYLNAKEAGTDFAVQGEYVGEVTTDDGKTRVGIQVIALGKGKFRAVAYPGGLPGDGWDGKTKITADGETKNGIPTFQGDKGSATIENKVMTVLTKAGIVQGKLKKTLRVSSTMNRKPPKGAVVLFDGSTAKHFKNGKMTKDGLLQQGVTSKRKFQSFQLHIEFQLSFMPYARGQGRSNSGVYMQSRYEVQILDSFGLAGKHNECGGVYSIHDPDVNMCYPPLSWQTFDIDFTAAQFDDTGKKIKNARMTVRHNGVVIHKDLELPKSTTAAPVKVGPAAGPLYIQNHGNPVRFRNIWLVEKK
ncbi:MAG: DUF1080 domain-containing protein [Planctomycetes bacterium]|nr:DUF1080 domain-containing protein [Planctomycetota bacterium]